MSMLQQLPLKLVPTVTGPRCLVIAPHPDDESIGCGGTIIYLIRKGVDVHVVFLTCDEWSLRGREAASALRCLGVTKYEFFNLPDNRIQIDHAVRSKMSELIQSWDPTSYFVPHELDPHPDHRQSNNLVKLFIRDDDYVYFYEVWSPLPFYNCSIDISETYPLKEEALRQYESQDKKYNLVTTAGALAEFRGFSRPVRKCRRAEVFLVRSGKEFKNYPAWEVN